MERTHALPSMSATRASAIAFGVLTGVARMEHGFFEVLQGSKTPSGLLIEAIGPTQRFWEYGTEIAMTVVPNFLVTGILATIVGLAIVVWSSVFIQTRYGAHGLAFLSVLLLLFGGGFAPVFGAVLAIVAASRIGKPLTWWNTHISARSRRFLARSWKWSTTVVAILYLSCIVSGIFGWPILLFFALDTANSVLLVAGLAVLVLMVYVLPAGLAYDIQKGSGYLPAPRGL